MTTQESSSRRNAALGVSAGLVLGGALGLMFGILIDNSPLWLILSAGGGMVIGLAIGYAVDMGKAG